MDVVIKIVAVIMVLVGVIYLFAGFTEKHKGIIIGGLVWWAGALATLLWGSLWPLPIAFLIALFLNKNPHHVSRPAPGPGDVRYGFDMDLGKTGFTVPYRIPAKVIPNPSKDIDDYCRQSRTHDGYKREAALAELVKHDLDAKASAYVLVALSDYVIEVSSLPLKVTAKTKKELRKIVQDNPRLVAYLDAVAISYWNEYYKDRYKRYIDYPPYKFLQTLKGKTA